MDTFGTYAEIRWAGDQSCGLISIGTAERADLLLGCTSHQDSLTGVVKSGPSGA
jgi:hypothetical protein